MKSIVKIIYYSLFFCFTAFGCKSNSSSFEDKYTLKASGVDSIVLPLDKDTKNFSYHLQYFEVNHISYLAILNLMDNSIQIFDIKKQCLHKKLKIPIEGDNAFPRMRSFRISEKLDSILLFRMDPPEIAIIDTSGIILKTISHPTKTGTLQQGALPILLGSNVFFVQQYPAHESNGILTTTGQKRTYLNVTVNLITGESTESELKYPEELIGKAVFIMPVNRTIGYKNNFVYHFGLLNSLLITKDHKEFSNVPLETNYKIDILSPNLSDPIDKAVRDMLTHDHINCIYYDKYRECYYVVIRKKEEISSQNSSSLMYKFTYPNSLIIILDKNLRDIGEVHLPDDTYSFRMLFITEEGVYISEDHINNPYFNEDQMRFRLFTLERVRK